MPLPSPIAIVEHLKWIIDQYLICMCTQAASAQSTKDPAASGIGGKIEQAAGSAVGCEGMEQEGKEAGQSVIDDQPLTNICTI